MQRKRLWILGITLFIATNLFAQKMTVKDSEANVLMEVNDEGSVGSITLPQGTAPGTTTGKLYNVGGSLFWNGTALGAGATDINGLSDAKTGGNNVFLGAGAGAHDDGSNNKNVAVGINALNTNTEGDGIMASGFQALYSNTTGVQNTASGMHALYSNTEGNYNTAAGTYALLSNTTGNRNIGIGYGANYLNEEGSNNTIIGHMAGIGSSFHNKSGNVFIGYQAGYNEIGSNKLYIENSNN